MIVSFGAMGVGYAYWVNDLNLNANMSITTGCTDATYSLKDSFYDIENVGFLDINVDDNKLIVEGEVYPGFNHNFDIDIIDKGTVPLALKEIEELDNKDEVAGLEKNKEYSNGFRTFGTFSKRDGSLYMSNSIQDEVRDTLNLSIAPDIEENSSKNRAFSSVSISSNSEDEIESLKNRIRELRQELDEYESMREDFNFKYNLLLEQDL